MEIMSNIAVGAAALIAATFVLGVVVIMIIVLINAFYFLFTIFHSYLLLAIFIPPILYYIGKLIRAAVWRTNG